MAKVIAAATRSALAARPAVAGQSAFLREAGRSGEFMFDSSNLSAKVAADTAQGIYIAPASASSGASGAWVRQFDFAARCTWFGILPGIGDVSSLVVAAIATLKTLANPQSAYGYGRGSIGLYFPELGYGVYNMGSTTIDITHTIEIFGDNRGGASGTASILKWSGNVTGFRTQAEDTSGATAGPVSNPYGSAQTTIRNLGLVGGYVAGAGESEAHAIHLRNKAILKNLYIDAWAGDGIYGRAHVHSTDYRGNDNGSILDNIYVYGCRNAIYFESPDTNGIEIRNPNCKFNRRYAIWIKDNIGVNIYGGDVSANGSVPNFHTKCSYDGGSGSKWYACLPDQEAWASVNPPTGTTANNQGWYYLIDAVAAQEAPVWTNGMAIRAGGSIRIEGVGNQTSIFGTYMEGDQPPPFVQGNVVTAAPMLGYIANFDGTPYGGTMAGDASSFQLARSLIVGGVAANRQQSGSSITSRGDIYLTRDSSIVYNPTLHINTTSTQANITFERLTVVEGRIQYDHGQSSIYHFVTNAAGAHRYYVGGNAVADIGPNGVSQEAFKAYDATTWNGSKRAATENDVRDKLESLSPSLSLRWIATHTQTAVTSFDVEDFAGLTGLGKIVIDIEWLTVSADNIDITMQFKLNGAYKTSADYKYSKNSMFSAASPTASNQGAIAGTSIGMFINGGGGIGAAAGEGASGEINIRNAYDTTRAKKVAFNTEWIDDQATPRSCRSDGAGTYTGTDFASALEGIRFAASSGTMSFRLHVYGVAVS